VTYRPNVHVVERAEGLSSLLSVSSDGSTLVFDRTRGALTTLATGDIVLIKGLLARKVIAVETAASELAVLTVPVGLLDLVSDGQIRVQAPIHFGAPQSGRSAMLLPNLWDQLTNVVAPSVLAQTEDRRRQAERAGVKDAYGNLAKAPFKSLMSGWETSFSVTPTAGRLNVTIELKKSMAGVAAVVTGEGYLADFDFSSAIDVEQSVVERLEMGYKKLNGVMNFTWKVATDEGATLRGNARIKLPAAIEIPLYQYLGGLPLFLELSSAVLIKPAIGAGHEYSHGAFRITFDGYQAFRVKEGNVDSDGSVTGDIQLLTVDNRSALAPLGMVVAFAAPRIELSIGVSKILKFDDIKEGAAKADKYFDLLGTRVFGQDAVDKFKKSPMQILTPTKIVEAAMGSNAAAFIELVTSTGMSDTGSSVMVPCTRTDIHLKASVGASASAFGQKVGDAQKDIFTKDFTRVKPSENALCAAP
jgi:hypothetical protein